MMTTAGEEREKTESNTWMGCLTEPRTLTNLRKEINKHCPRGLRLSKLDEIKFYKLCQGQPKNPKNTKCQCPPRIIASRLLSVTSRFQSDY